MPKNGTVRKLNPLQATLIGLTGGLISSFAYPNNSIWFAIFPAVALIVFACVSVSARASLLVGFASGFAFYASQIPWMTVYLGPVPWLALSFLEAVIFAIGAFAMNLVWRKLRHQVNSVLLSLAIASVWTTREWLACNFPYGGFPWSRVALSQSNSPLANWVYWGGNSLLSLIIVFGVVLFMLEWKRGLLPKNWSANFSPLVLVLMVLVPQLTPVGSLGKVGDIKVAAVQGNANAGLFANPRPGSILENHLVASAPLISGSEKYDVVIWPENAADENPLANPSAKQKIADFTKTTNTPLVFGTITERGSDIYNSSILWLPNVGAVDWYDKKRPVAFGEFVPDRAFFRALAPELIDLIPRGYSFGTRDGIFIIPSHNQTRLGTMICFEVAVDDISRDLVQQGAEILAVQTNNSDFGKTNESAQQLAIAKLRAIETGRAVVNISTVGISAIIMPTGEVVDELATYIPGIMSETLPRYSGFTPAMLFGGVFDLVNNFAALGLILFVLTPRRKWGVASEK